MPALSSALLLLLLSSTSGLAAANSGGKWADCTGAGDVEHGPLNTTFLNTTFNKTIFYGQVPTPSSATTGPFPLVVFMHGSTGQWGMYQPNIVTYATHGFVVLFPFIKSPEKDKNPLTTNTNGEYILKGVEFGKAANRDPSSPLYGLIDTSNIIIAGHSMGATCSIMAGKRLAPGSVKLLITQHPGICGPFGPPPWPATWLPSDLVNANSKSPMLFTTATNDGAFWPAPHTAEHELGCFNKARAGEQSIPPRSFSKLSGPVAFVQFSAKACAEDGKRAPFKDSGHTCPFKAEVETPWVTRALKLYGQHNGSKASACYDMLWGSGSGSMRNASTVDQAAIIQP